MDFGCGYGSSLEIVWTFGMLVVVCGGWSCMKCRRFASVAVWRGRVRGWYGYRMRARAVFSECLVRTLHGLTELVRSVRVDAAAVALFGELV